MEKDKISYILGKLDTKTLADLPHYIFPSPNLHKNKVLEVGEEFDHENSYLEWITQAKHFYRQFPYDSSLPIPIVEPKAATVQALNGCDPALSLVRNKVQWEKKKDFILSANLKDIKRLDKNAHRSMRNIKHDRLKMLPRGVAMLASHLAQDPDPCFSGTYNWYYGGGTLATHSTGDESFILSSTGVNESSIQLMSLLKNANGWKSQEVHTVSMSDNSSPIHQMLASEGYIAVRQKKQVTIFIPEESKDGTGLHLKRLHSAVIKESKTATFVSTSVSPSIDLQYCTLANDGVVRLWQPRTKMKCVSKMKIGREKNVPMDNWGSVQYHDENTILMSNRNRVHLLDTRSMKKVQSWCHSHLCEMCEDLSMCATSSRQQHLKYLGTNHQVLGLDVRFGFSQRWTHLMSAPPYIGCVTPVNTDDELLLIGSHNLQEAVAIVNNCRSENATSNIFPKCLPSPLEALCAARSRSACLVPLVEMRCRMSLTGLCCLPKHDSLLILRQNSLGDIFLQELQNRKDSFQSRFSDHEFELLEDWGNQCAKVVEVPESLCNIKALVVNEFFKAVAVNKIDESVWTEIHQRPLKNDRRFKKHIESWQILKQYLEECVDEHSSKLFSAWGVEGDDEWIDLDEEEEEDPTHKVHNWLDSSPLKFGTGILGVEPLNEGAVYSDQETYEKNKKEERFVIKKLFPHKSGINEDKMSQKRRLSTSPVLMMDDRVPAQLTPKPKKSKLCNTDILDEGSVNSLPLPRRKFLDSQSPVQSHRSYSLIQDVRNSQPLRHHAPKPSTPHRLRNLSPVMFGSKYGSIENVSITPKSKNKLDTTPVLKLSQQVSSQYDMFAGMSPLRSQLGPDFPAVLHSSQKSSVKPQTPQLMKKKFVAGF